MQKVVFIPSVLARPVTYQAKEQLSFVLNYGGWRGTTVQLMGKQVVENYCVIQLPNIYYIQSIDICLLKICMK